MIAVVHTSGIFRVWSTKTTKCIAEYDLLRENNPDDNPSQTEKIIQAKIQFISHPFLFDEMTKTIEVSVAYQSQSIKNYKNRWFVT